MSKVRPQEDPAGTILFECPGCNHLHAVTTKKPNGMGSQWTWDGDVDEPTFKPSVMVTMDITNQPTETCHSFVTVGKIRFLNDSTHHLAGQCVDLPDFE